MINSKISPEEAQERLVEYTVNVISFIEECVQIEDAVAGKWIPFILWEEQEEVIFDIENNRLVIILKARQVGLSWLVLAFALWLMIFRPAAQVTIFSRRETEAIYLLKDRLKEMYKRLPDFITGAYTVLKDNDNEWSLSNGSVARAFSPSSGDTYITTLAIMDEADLIPDFGGLMASVQPTIDAGGRMIVLSRSNKKKPGSHFKAIYRAAKELTNGWKSIFLAWWVRPERTQEWYDDKVRDAQANSGSLDDIFEMYPATDTEALKPGTADKRLNSDWLEQCYKPVDPKLPKDAPALPFPAKIYKKPVPGRRYVLGVDTAEGLLTSDDSSIHVIEEGSGDEVFKMAGKFSPDVTASYADTIGNYYNKAPILVERNNHGHAVLLWLKEHSNLYILKGRDKRPGWQTNSLSKSLMYDHAAEMFRDEETTLRSFRTYTQLASIGAGSLSAPEGSHDDEAVSYCLALMARRIYKPKKNKKKVKSFQG